MPNNESLWKFTAEIILVKGGGKYIGQVNTLNEPNGFGIFVSDELDYVCESYWVNGKWVGRGREIGYEFTCEGCCHQGKAHGYGQVC